MTVASLAKYVRHKKRGSTYEIIRPNYLAGKSYIEGDLVPIRVGMSAPLFYAEFQISRKTPLTLMDILVVYRCLETGKHWCREINEFNDGRFEVIDKPSLVNGSNHG